MLDDLEKCYKDTSIFIFRVGCSRTTWPSHITKYLSRLLPDFKEVGAPFDPKQPSTYSRISQLIATYDSHLVRVEPESSLEFIKNIYLLRIALRIIPMCSHRSITCRTEYGPSSSGWLRCDLDCTCIYSSLNYFGIIQLLSIDRTNSNEHSYWSLANQSFESALNSLSVYFTCNRYGLLV